MKKIPVNIYGGNKRKDRPNGGFYANLDEPTSKTLDSASGLNPSCSQGGTAVIQIAFQQNTRDEVRLINGDGQIVGALMVEPGMKQQNYMFSPSVGFTRRLTPKECERLQGFPDDLTLIEFKGKPSADSPRLRALGNSMAVPVMLWVGLRIKDNGCQS